MATQEEASGAGAGAAAPTVGLALRGSKSSTHLLRWALARFGAKDDDDSAAAPAFRLIHVLTPVRTVPTPRMLRPLIPVFLLTFLSSCLNRFQSFSPLAHYVFVEMFLCGLAPVGNYIPIDKACDNIAEGYLKEVWVKAQRMLARCKSMCDENKVPACLLRVAIFYTTKCIPVSCLF
jgi:hypothetical protein